MFWHKLYLLEVYCLLESCRSFFPVSDKKLNLLDFIPRVREPGEVSIVTAPWLCKREYDLAVILNFLKLKKPTFQIYNSKLYGRLILCDWHCRMQTITMFGSRIDEFGLITIMEEYELLYSKIKLSNRFATTIQERNVLTENNISIFFWYPTSNASEYFPKLSVDLYNY